MLDRSLSSSGRSILGAVGLPSGTVTLLFTDIEGSTRLLHELGDRYVEVLADHRRVLRVAAAEQGGVEVDTQGDAFFFAFPSAAEGVAAAHAAQRALSGSPVRVRMGIHTGEPTVTAEGYVGMDVHRGARICAAGHGGQILISKRTRDSLDTATEVRDLGEHRLKDLQRPEWLYQVIAADLEPRFPPLRSLSNTNLPAEASTFIGRRRELDELGALLRRVDVRLLSLTGAGGTGKTRLAMRLAAESVEDFKNGVFFVPLASLDDSALVLETVAQALGVREALGETGVDGLRRQLDGKQVLLVLDNFEHLIDAAPHVSSLLASAPQLKAVVTSRERLRLAGEHEYAVAPLSEQDAISLFGVRARALEPGFRIEDHRASVTAICRRLDGLPLALELAAARIKVLTPQALLVRLDQALPNLAAGPRDAPDRQRTLRAAIEWSYVLLSEREQDIFARLSVFVGGFDTAAAAEICGAMFDDLVSLHDKSLLRKDDAPVDEPRFSMLQTIREFARDQLTARSQTDELEVLHTRYFAALAHTRADGRGHGLEGPRSPNEVRWLDWLERESGNLHAALARLIDGADVDQAVQLVFSLWRLWLVRRPLAEGRLWTERVLAKDGLSELADYGWLLTVASEFPRFQGDFARARDLATRAIAVLRERNQRNRLAIAIEAVASVATSQGEYLDAKALHEETLALGRELNSPFRIAHALNGLSVLAFRQGNFARMLDLAGQQLEVSYALKDETFISAGLHSLGEAQRHQGMLGPAAKNYEEALRLGLHLGDAATIAECLDGIGDVAAAMGEFALAVSLWAVAHRMLEESGDRPWDPDGAERARARARGALGQSAYDEAWRSGTAMTRADAAVTAATIVNLAQEERVLRT